MSAKTIARYVFGLVLAIVLLAWVLRGTDPALLLDQLAHTSVAWLTLSIALNFGHAAFRVWRWGALLAPVRRSVPFRPMFAAVILGYMTSWIVPGRIGELVRPLALSGQTGVPLGPCLGSVVADRLLDACTVVVLFAAAGMLVPLEGAVAEYAGVVRGGALALGTFVVVSLAAMLVASGNSRRLGAWLERRGRVVAWIGNSVLSLSHGVSALRRPVLLARIVAHSLLVWLAIAASTWAGLRSVGVELRLAEVLFILPLLVLGVAVPTPGGAGSYHGLMKVGLMWFGVDELSAVSAALVVHASITVPVILLGMLLLWTEGLSWRHLMKGARQLRTLGDRQAGELDRVVEEVS